MDGTQVIKVLERRTSLVNNLIAVVMPIAIVVGAFYWYKEHLWEPKIELDNVDYEKGIATVKINGKVKPLYAGSVLSATFGWGVRFAGKQFDTWDRIEIVKHDMTKRTLSIK